MLATTGIIFAHVSANVFNEYFDFKSGIDFETNKTPFNGGSGVLPGGLISSGQALWLALGCLTLAIPIGIFFVINSGPGLLPVLGISLFCIVFYTPMITRIGWPEWSPGLAFGFLPVMAFYFIQTGHFAMPAFVIAVPLGILGHNLLLINEIPDVEADRKAGRRTLPITLGKKRAALVYASLVIIMYLWIIGWIAAGEIPFFGIFCLLSLPFAVKAISVYKCYNNPRKLAGAQAANVALFLSVTFILGAAYVGSGAFSNNGMFR